MAVDVMIKRKVKQGRQAKELVPLIMHLRALATYQPSYLLRTPSQKKAVWQDMLFFQEKMRSL